MDLHYTHPTNILVVRACLHNDANDLVAVCGEHSVDILQVAEHSCRCIAVFHVGTRITAAAWSSSSISPSSSDEWVIELVVADSDHGLHLLTKSPSSGESIFAFGGGLSGHHGKINDMSFCGGWGEDSSRYVATVSDDKMLMVWDMRPVIDVAPRSPSLADSPPPSRPQPTAYVIPFSHSLVSISCHPSTSKEFLVADCRGSLYVTDWCSDPEDRNNLRHSTKVELVEPYGLSTVARGFSNQLSGSAAWRADTTDIIGAVCGSRYSIWNTGNLKGGKPFISQNTFTEGGHKFRWCQTYPEYFAISTQSPNKGAVIHVHNINFLHAQPTVFNLHPRPHFIRDFDIMALQGIPRIVAAVGRTATLFSIGIES